jgi:glycosyltransferase involved in cell wall biosynthesis
MASAIVVFSHLRWDSMFHRPQQLMSTLAEHHSIVFIEEPVHDERGSFLHTYAPAPNILVCQPHTTLDAPDFRDWQLPALHRLLQQVTHDHDERMAWFYTPMALPLLGELQPGLVAYDCVDEPAPIHAPALWRERESALLEATDIVFTNSRNRYRTLCERHPNVHCFPDSVDAAHFLPAHDRSNSHPAHRHIPGPRLGFHGVIDRRFDVGLIGRLADAHTQWHIVLVGPVIGIDPASLPQRHNIHYLGRQAYRSLPHFLAGWDVCLLPFGPDVRAGSAGASRLLEYMAAELPIVATPAADVAEAYADLVTVAQDAQAFIAACEAALLAPREESARRAERMRAALAATSWRRTAEQMHALLMACTRRVGVAGNSQDEGFDEEREEAAQPRLPDTPAGLIDIGLIRVPPTGLSAACGAAAMK